ncbi:hypothetical protein Tco_0483700 [Tanacetum coccineum]
MDNPDFIMEEYIKLKAEKARRCGQTFNWETATYNDVIVVVEISDSGIDANVDTQYHEFDEDFETNHDTPDAFTTHNLAHKRNMKNHSEQVPREFLILILLKFCP